MKTILFTQGHASQRAVVRLARAGLPRRHPRARLPRRRPRGHPRRGRSGARGARASRSACDRGALRRLAARARPPPRGRTPCSPCANRTALVARRADFAAAGYPPSPAGATTLGGARDLRAQGRLRRAPAGGGAAGARDAPASSTRRGSPTRSRCSRTPAASASSRRRASTARGFWRLDPQADAFAHLEDPDRRVVHPAAFVAGYAGARQRARLVVMEYLSGDEHSIDVVCDAGRLVAAAARRKSGACQIRHDVRAADRPRRRGRGRARPRRARQTSSCARTRPASPRCWRSTLRYSGGVGYSAAAGVNLPAIAAGDALGHRPAGGRLRHARAAGGAHRRRGGLRCRGPPRGLVDGAAEDGARAEAAA